jgi:hypothetical protein
MGTITYHPKNDTTINVKLDNKIVGQIKSKKNSPGFAYVPKGQSWSKGLFEMHESLEACKAVLEAE